MTEIEVLRGLRFTPEMFLKRMEHSKKLKKQGITVRQVNTIYSLCWIFQLRIRIPLTKKKDAYAGYYAGFDESVMSPGKLARLPSAEKHEVAEEQILGAKLTEQEALDRIWEYNKVGVMRKYRVLSAPPEVEDYKVDRYYKPLFVFEFYNSVLKEKKYRVLDSLTGDLEEIEITG